MTMSPETKTSEALTQNLPTLYRDLIEHSPLPMVAAGGKNHIVGYVNLAFCNLVGKKKEDRTPFLRDRTENRQLHSHYGSGLPHGKGRDV
jgi:hypothetical protein